MNRWDALCRYTEHSGLLLDNNLSERTLRAVAIGRRNYLFAGSDRGAGASANHYSLTPHSSYWASIPIANSARSTRPCQSSIHKKYRRCCQINGSSNSSRKTSLATKFASSFTERIFMLQQNRMAMVADLLKPNGSPAGPPHRCFFARRVVVAIVVIEQFLANGSGAGRWPGRCSGYGWLLLVMRSRVDVHARAKVSVAQRPFQGFEAFTGRIAQHHSWRLSLLGPKESCHVCWRGFCLPQL